MQKQTKHTLKTYWEHSREYKKSLILVISVVVLTTVIQIISPILVKHFLNALVSPNQGHGDLAMKYVYYIATLSIISQALYRALFYGMNFHEARVMSNLLKTGFSYLLGHSYGFYTDNFAGSIGTRIRRFYYSFERVTDVIMFEGLPLILKMGLILTVVFTINMQLGFVILAWSTVFIIFSYLAQKYKLPHDKALADQDSHVSGYLSDVITNIQNVKVFTAHENEKMQFAGITEKLYQLRLKSWNLSTHISIFQGSAMVLLEFLVLYMAVGYYRSGLLTLGDVVLLNSYVAQVMERMWNFGRSIKTLYEGFADASEMSDMMMLNHEVTDAEKAPALLVTSGKVEFQNVGFQYDHGNKIFHGFNLSIKPGEKIALVGPSGGGKSTIVKLLFRFKDIQEGQIFIDNQNICDVTQASLRHEVSLVPQDPILFHRSLMDNIRYGKPDAADEEVIEAAKLAHAHGFISKCIDGYNTLVGERGVKLSGGEKQRIAIARAILKNSPILVLDEATSSLDSESEILIQDGLAKLMKGKTTIVIAHRLSTIRMMDRIVVIENGQIKEEGTHEELLCAQDGTYQRLWDIQVNGFAAAG